MAKQANSGACWALSPDANGSYVAGTWTPLAPMQGNRVWFASAVLADGRLLVSGGEVFNGSAIPTNLSEIYDPPTDSWAPVAPPVSPATRTAAPTPWTQIGDASSAVLADGRMLIGNIQTREVAVFDPKTQTFTVSPNLKAAICDEESWVLMPDGTVVTIETNNPPFAEKYLPASDTWVSANRTSVNVLAAGGEIGAGLALPGGDGMTLGGNGTIVRYTPDPNDVTTPGRWSNGPTFPADVNGLPFQPKDAPACLLPDGRVLAAVNPNDQGNTATSASSKAQQLLAYPKGLFFFLYDPVAPVGSALQPVDATAVRTGGNAYAAAMLLLPTGQVLLTLADGDGRTFVYNPVGIPAQQWRPAIEPVPYRGRAGTTIRIYGRRFNGISQGSAYGDDVAAATNYPLARLVLADRSVHWARTHRHSTMAIATGDRLVWTDIDIPAHLGNESAELSIVTNGIASESVALTILAPSAPALYAVEQIQPSRESAKRQFIPRSGGRLRWYRHEGWDDGTFKWMGPTTVGTEWANFRTAFGGGDGIVYAVTEREPLIVPVEGTAPLPAGGNLLWYQHLGQSNGTFTWNGPQTVGTDWDEFVYVFSGGNGVLYGVKRNGDLMWYRHLGHQDGSFHWLPPKKVGHGWAHFKQVFSTGDGVIYAIEKYDDSSATLGGPPQGQGRLLWYRHNGWVDGTDNWEAHTVVGHRWADFQQAFAGIDGVIYAVEKFNEATVPIEGHAIPASGGHLLWYRHLGQADGTFHWTGPHTVGRRWSDFKYSFAQ